MNNSTSNDSKYQINEVRDFHPIVQKWLEDQGYPYEHHRRILDGIVDFFAIIDGARVLIECKVNPVKSRDCAQLLGYCADMPDSRGIMALPSYAVDERTIQVCNQMGIELIQFDTGIGAMSKMIALDAIRQNNLPTPGLLCLADELVPNGAVGFQRFTAKFYWEAILEWMIKWKPSVSEIENVFKSDLVFFGMTDDEISKSVDLVRQFCGE